MINLERPKFKNVKELGEFTTSGRQSAMFGYLEEKKRFQDSEEGKLAARWTRNYELQKRLVDAKTYVEKLAIIKNEGTLGIERNRVEPQNFMGPIQMFDGRNGRTKTGHVKVFSVDYPNGEVINNYNRVGGRPGLVEENLKALNEKRRDYKTIPEVKYASDTMELIFTDLAHYIFGSDFEVCISSGYDDEFNAADVVLIKKDESGRIQTIIPIDFFVGIDQEEVKPSRYLERKLLAGLSRTREGVQQRLNYIQSGDKKLSAMNLQGLVLPISRNNLELLAEAYYKGESTEILFEFRRQILESFKLQIEARKKVASTITNGSDIWKRDGILGTLKSVRGSLGFNVKDTGFRRDTILESVSQILSVFKSDLAGQVSILDELIKKRRERNSERNKK